MKSPELEQEVGARLLAAGLTVATAESCSGGLIAHRITNVPGASAYFLGGVVVYRNDAKVLLLGVSTADLAAYGAVSEPVARQMAEGVRSRLGADFGIGVTGVAGPEGGTAEKPVGLVYVAVADAAETVVTRNVFSGGREAVKAQTADRALSMLIRNLELGIRN